MNRLLARIRVLPVTILVAALMLTVRLGDIWQGVDGLLGGVPAAEAQEAANQPPRPEPAPSPAQAQAQAQAEPKGETSADARAADSEPPPRLGDDPTLFTQSEIDLLQQLAERREELEKRAQELEMRAGLLQAAEARIDRKVAELQQLRQTIEGLVQTNKGQQDRKLESLVKIYENMKPKDAARIFEELDMDTLLMVADRMKERRLAPIMAEMDPAKARQMTVELARLRDLPTPGMGPQG